MDNKPNLIQKADDLVCKARGVLGREPHDLWGPVTATLANLSTDHWAAIRALRASQAECDRLRDVVDVLCGPPLTFEEAEAAMDEADAAALDGIDIKRIIAYATDPANIAPELALERMVKAAEGIDGFDARAIRDARACLEARGFGARMIDTNPAPASPDAGPEKE